ncbi:hypothetical protein VTH82DRAFT_5754 [Thermothelomyces myriococcoides]
MSLATAPPAEGRGAIPALAESSDPQRDPGATSGDAQREVDKKKKRSLFGFGKKKTTEVSPKATPPDSKPPPQASDRTTTMSPVRTDHPPLSPSSPGRYGLASSPRLASPAGSQIFERDVQESATSLIPSSPAIPSHILTENHVPPVLDASSEAITDDHLSPDSVEIITHTSHQPAALAVTGGLGGYPPVAPTEASWAEELAAFSASDNNTNPTPATAETASNYGSIDTADVRRLSFISFADVVLAEQSQNDRFFAAGGGSPSRESTYLAGLSTLSQAATSAAAAANHPRSASPIRSPVSSPGSGGRPGSVSPPTSKSGSVKGFDPSAARAARASSPAGRAPSSLGSPASLLSSAQLSSPGGGATVSGEIAIETMTQALRRTGSGDMSIASGLRSFPASPTV